MDDSGGPAARPFKCSSCDKSFTRQENLKRHINSHHKGINARSFQCTQCTARFARSDLRKRHVENCHVPSFAAAKRVTATQPPQDINIAEIHMNLVAESPTTSAWLDLLMSTDVPAQPAHSQPTQPINNPQSLPPIDAPLTSIEVPSDVQCIASFFSSFHQNFPVLHEASFHIVSAPLPLLHVITCIGSLYSPSPYSESSRKLLFDSTLSSMRNYAEQNRSRYQETWVFQTFLLLEYLGIFGGDDGCFLQAQRIHRDLVDAMRMLQMSHDGVSGYSSDDSSVESEGEDESSEESEKQPLEIRWQEFVKKESRKRCIYSLYLLDSQLSILCNMRPMISSLEIKYDLPCCEDMWLAKSAEFWLTCQKNQFKSFDSSDDQVYSQETPPSQAFFYEASQTLLHPDKGKRQPRKLRLLWASPFSAVILVTQLQMMARELTHASCLLERPKSRRRTLSVLTDKQQAQISQALKGIAELVPRSQRPVFNFFDITRMSTFLEAQDTTPLWHTFWVLWYYTSITLSHPDSLLVSGVVESNLPLAIATAGHLATPRSKDKRDIYQDGDVFRILNDLELALEILNPLKSTCSPLFESPFITLIGFKICLVGWRLVRLTMGEAGDAAKRGQRSNPSKFVLDAIMASLDTGEDDIIAGQEFPPPRDTVRSEIEYLEWIVMSFKKRATWPTGEWISAVMEESLEKAKAVCNSSIA